ncbi:MAG: trigger factor [bacterium]
MQVSVESTGTLGRKLTVNVPADEINKQVDGKLSELSRTIQLKGFRQGKVPVKVVRRKFGAQVRAEILNDVFKETFQEAVTQEKLEPAGTPRMTDQQGAESGDFHYTVEFDVYPTLEDTDVSAIKLERPVAEVEDKDIDNMIETLQMQRRDWVDVERASKEKDLVMFEYTAELDGVTYPESGKERIGGILGSGALFNGFEEALSGKKLDEEGEAEVEFPKNFRIEELKGKTAKVNFNIVRVAEEQLPEVNAEFMESFGVEDGDMENFRKEVRSNLKRELKGAITAKVKSNVFDALIAKYDAIELPDGMIEQEQKALREQGIHMAQQQGLDEAAVPDEASYAEEAERRVRSGLILRGIVRNEKIELDQQMVREYVEDMASTYESPAEIIQYYYSNEQLMAQASNEVLETQVVDWVIEHAKTKDKEYTFNELLRPGAED